MKETTKLKEQALSEINSASDLKHLDQLRVDYLGKKGRLTEQLKMLGLNYQLMQDDFFQNNNDL